MGAVLVFLIVMAASFTGKAGGRRKPPAAFVVPAGGVAGCADSEALCLVADPQPPADTDYRGRPRQVSGARGLVASDQSRCADIGAEVLQEGGHAVDAAVATALCQGVVNPFASGLGGGHFALIRSANGSAEVVNAREPAPAAAHRDMYAGLPANASLNGGLAVAVPLELLGLEAAWRRHGVLPWARLVLPAAAIAAHGFAAHPYYVHVLTGNVTLPRLRSNPLAAAAFLVADPAAPAGFRAPRVGELCCRRPALAATLRQAAAPGTGQQWGPASPCGVPLSAPTPMCLCLAPPPPIAAHGASWLYSGPVAEALAAEVRAAGGVITARDLQTAQPRIEAPLRLPLPGPPGGPAALELLVPAPPSSGAVLALALAIVAGYGGGGGNGSDPGLAAHRMVEAMKHAFAVRSALGDPGPTGAAPRAPPPAPFADVRAVLADCANASFADMLRSRTNDSWVLPLSRYGGRWNPELAGHGPPPEDAGTSHLAVLDAAGNAVSLTTTINTGFGSGVVSRSTGILLNNQMDDFSRPGLSNTYGLAPAEANFIGPAKRPLSSMAPAMLLERQEGQGGGAAGPAGGGGGEALRLVVGASGGPRILTGIMQTVLRLLYEAQPPAPLAAVAGGRLHAQWAPDRVLAEDYSLGGVDYGSAAGVLAGLAERGQTLVPYADQLGDVQAILLGRQAQGRAQGGGAATAVSDPRKDGAPAAVA